MNYAELNRIIEESGLKRSYIAEAIGMSSVAFSNRTRGRVQWKTEEIQRFCKVLNLPRRTRDYIFLP